MTTSEVERKGTNGSVLTSSNHIGDHDNKNGSTENAVASCRKLPFLSECIYFPITCLSVFLHVITKPIGIEPAVSMFLAGGFFGMVLIPLGFAVLFMHFLDVFVYNGISSFLYTWVGIPFAVSYFIQILCLDTLHTHSVDNANPNIPRNRLEKMSEEFFKAGHEYLPFTCIPWSDDAKLDPVNQQYIFAVHPHGIHCTPLMTLTTRGSVFDKAFPNMVGKHLTGLSATVLFKLPLVRELFLIMGYVDASRSVAQRALHHNRSLFVCTGGEEESMLAEPGQDVVVLKKRKGFIRLALSHGASIVPVFGVGNSDLYKTYKIFERQRMWLQKNFSIALPIFHGRWFTPLPYKITVKVLIGKPIPTPKPKVKGERPDEKLVEEYHAKYIAALNELYAQHVPDRTLQIQ